MDGSWTTACLCATAGAVLLLPRTERVVAPALLLAAAALAASRALRQWRSVDDEAPPAGGGGSSNEALAEMSALIAESILKRLPQADASADGVADRLRRVEAEQLELRKQLCKAQSQAESWRVTASELAQLLNQLGQSMPVAGDAPSAPAPTSESVAEGGDDGGSNGTRYRTVLTEAPRSPEIHRSFDGSGTDGQMRRRFAMPTMEITDLVAHEHAHQRQHSRRRTVSSDLARSSGDLARSSLSLVDSSDRPASLLTRSTRSVRSVSSNDLANDLANELANELAGSSRYDLARSLPRSHSDEMLISAHANGPLLGDAVVVGSTSGSSLDALTSGSSSSHDVLLPSQPSVDARLNGPQSDSQSGSQSGSQSELTPHAEASDELGPLVPAAPNKAAPNQAAPNKAAPRRFAHSVAGQAKTGLQLIKATAHEVRISGESGGARADSLRLPRRLPPSWASLEWPSLMAVADGRC